MKSKKFLICLLTSFYLVLLIIGLTMYYIDPAFHYHKPLKNIAYVQVSEYFQNDGIMKYFDYDAVITGTSMTENFKTSELDDLFGTNSIKVPLSGESFYGVNNGLKVAFSSKNEIKMVVRALDIDLIIKGKDELTRSKEYYPTYIHDNNLFNDVNYVFNKDFLIEYLFPTIINTINKKKMFTFDEYANWMEGDVFGKEVLDSIYVRDTNKKEKVEFSEDDLNMVLENIKQNLIQIAIDNPNTEFYYFIPPHSIYYFDRENQNGTLEEKLSAVKVVYEEITKIENIHLFSFLDDFDLICDLNNFKDFTHYGEWVNSYILQCLKQNEHLITVDNYLDNYEKILEFYSTYDYDALFINEN